MEGATELFTSVPIDIFVIGALVAVIGIDAVKHSIGRASALAVAMPLGLFLYSLIPSTLFLGTLDFLRNSPSAERITLIICIILAYILARRIGLEFVSGAGGLMQGIFAGVAATVVLIVIWLHAPILDSLYHLSDPVRSLFAEPYRLFWLLGSYAILAFARG
jgi:hypothetical protein